jgi:hypothetical protein
MANALAYSSSVLFTPIKKALWFSLEHLSFLSLSFKKNAYCLGLERLHAAQCYKTFFVRNLRISVISSSVCPWQTLQV